MKIVLFVCDECNEEARILSPHRYPPGWRRLRVNETELWDLCPPCVAGEDIAPKPDKVGEINRDLVRSLLELLPGATDQKIAEEAFKWGIQMSGETVRRHRVALGIPNSRKRRRVTLN